MTCFHGYAAAAGCEAAFAVDTNALTFGAGVIDECGPIARGWQARRVALVTDRRVGALAHTTRARESLRAAGCDVVEFADVMIEPTDRSVREAIAFARATKADAYISVGGGSVIDTCKIAALYAAYPAELMTYVNAPIGGGQPVPGALPPHLACPTTAGTGSECTGIAIFDHTELHLKTGIASRRLRPTAALVDPIFTETLPAEVVASAGFDVLCHAIESYTARPFTARPRPDAPSARPMSQGRNPWSDLGCTEAMRLGGQYLVRATMDARDVEARRALAWAATLAGIAFGNAGVHVPHAMSYAVAGLSLGGSFTSPGYPTDGPPFVPHGISVIVNAPSVFRALATTAPERHLAAAATIGADVRGASLADAGERLAARIIELMRATQTPNGIGGVGFGIAEIAQLVAGTKGQRRLLDNAPRPVDETHLPALFSDALAYW